MSFEKTNTTAVAAYQNIQQNNHERHEGRHERNDKSDHHGKSRHVDKEENAFIKGAAKFMRQLDKLMQHNAFDLMSNADKSMNDLLKSTLDLQDKKDDDKVEKSGYKSLDDMIGALNRMHKTDESDD